MSIVRGSVLLAALIAVGGLLISACAGATQEAGPTATVPPPSTPIPTATASATPTPRSFAALIERPLAELSPEGAVFAASQEVPIGVAVVVPERDAIYTFAGDERFFMASLVKVPIMLAVLDRAIREGRTLTDDEVALLEPMIRVSDNDPAFQLWAELNDGEAVADYFESIGVTTFESGGPGNWAASRISPAGFARVLTQLARGVLFDPLSQTFALFQMSSVIPGQDWGVTAGAPEGARVALKNGWVYTEPDDWSVNSAGIVFPVVGQAYIVVVLTNGQQSKEAGVIMIEAISESIHAVLVASPR